MVCVFLCVNFCNFCGISVCMYNLNTLFVLKEWEYGCMLKKIFSFVYYYFCSFLFLLLRCAIYMWFCGFVSSLRNHTRHRSYNIIRMWSLCMCICICFGGLHIYICTHVSNDVVLGLTMLRKWLSAIDFTQVHYTSLIHVCKNGFVVYIFVIYICVLWCSTGPLIFRQWFISDWCHAGTLQFFFFCIWNILCVYVVLIVLHIYVHMKVMILYLALINFGSDYQRLISHKYNTYHVSRLRHF